MPTVTALSLDEAREKLTNALTIMDEKGRRAEGCTRIMLWEKDWDFLREEVLDTLTIVREIRENRIGI